MEPIFCVNRETGYVRIIMSTYYVSSDNKNNVVVDTIIKLLKYEKKIHGTSKSAK